jgi:TPR repeat protein
MLRRSILIACAGLSVAATATAHCVPSGLTSADIAHHGLLDPSISAERRQRLADRLLCSALAGHAASQELAGTLYLQGRARRGNMFPRDIPRARRLLTAAADRGRQQAMRALAELELADGHAHEAALWSRVEQELYGGSKVASSDAHPGTGRSATRDHRLDAEVSLKVQAILEALAADSQPRTE